ncbi:hypothetical protein ACP4OV_030115 [Aristida adscensionis]
MAASAPAAGDLPPLGSVPLLVYDHGRRGNYRQTTFSPADQSLRTAVVPEMSESNLHVTPHGWVFLQECGTRSARLWDPRSGDTVALPPTDESTGGLEPKLLYCRVGDSRWTAHEYDIGDVNLPHAPPRKRTIKQMAAVGGRFYFSETGQLGVIDFSSAPGPAFSYLDYPRVKFPDGSNCAWPHLVASRGELFEVEDLGDRVLLLSHPNAQLLCSASKYGLKGNHVYFNHNVMTEPDGGPMCIYDLDEKSLETVRPCPDMKDLMGNPFWMMPTDSD